MKSAKTISFIAVTLTGLVFESQSVQANRTVTAPMGAAYRMGLGAFWKVSQTVDLGAAYELAWSGDLPVTQGASGSYGGEVSGSYNNSCFSFFSVNLNWRF